MKRLYLLSVVVVLLMVLAACERPLREEPAVEATTESPTGLPSTGEGILPEAFPSGTDQSASDSAVIDDASGEASPAENNAAEDGATDTAIDSADGSNSVDSATSTGEGDGSLDSEIQLPASDIIHSVQAGETLIAISQLYDISVEEIVRANGLVNPDVLDVGDELLIPLTGSAVDDVSITDDTNNTANSERIHIVGAGDTLFRIGQLYGFTVEELAALNGIVNVNRLEIGQEVRIPATP